MILVDTSVWISVLKDPSGKWSAAFRQRTDGAIVVLCRFVQQELLQGARDEFEWEKLSEYLENQYYLEFSSETWVMAARVFFELRRNGLTVRSPIDCSIACIAMEHQALLLHRDRDFEVISMIRPLMNEYFDPGSVTR